MPAQQVQGDILAKHGSALDKAIQAHANDETKAGIINLPPGITQGVAKLSQARFGVYNSGPNKGEPFLFLMGGVIEPESVVYNAQVVTVRGLNTTQTLPFCETKDKDGKPAKSFEDNVAAALNHLRLLGGDDCTRNLKTRQDIYRLVEALAKAKPYFRFSTSERKNQTTGAATGTWENWHGRKGLEDYKPPVLANKVTDNSAAQTAAPPLNRVASLLNNGVEAPEQEDEGTTFDDGAALAETAKFARSDDEEDFDELIRRADSKDAAAQNRLESLAVAAGRTAEEVSDAESWEQVVGWIKDGTRKEEEGGEETAAEPSKGDMVKYRPISKTTGKPRAKPVDCEVTAVSKKNETCDLKNYEDPKITYTKVAWSALER